MIVFLNGKFWKESTARVSVFDHGFLYADGVYETLRTYGGIVWQMEEHLRRLKRSAALLGIDLPWSLEQVGKWIAATVRKNGFRESRIRVTVTRGANGFDFGRARKPTICIQVQRMVPQPARVYASGADVVTFRAERFLPEAKTLNLLPMILAQRFMAKQKAYEAIFVAPGGWIREGTVTNVFAVFGDILVTPRSKVLAGTTRDFLLKIAKKSGIETKLKDFTVHQFYRADEVFITNAPRGIVPVRSIDGRKIGKKCPGPITKMLTGVFRKEIEQFTAHGV